MKVSFYNIGCKVNFADMSEIAGQFRDAGYEVVDFGEDCDIVLINTCTVTNNADADSRKLIRRASRKNPGAFIGVMGCYSQLKPGEVAKIIGVDAVFGTNEKFRILDLIREYKKKDNTDTFISNLDEEIPFHSSSSADNKSRTRITLKIQDGCDYFCTYCAVPHARGRSRSMDFKKLEEKFIEIDKKGRLEIILSGINLGEYKAPSGEKFEDVIRLINSLDLKLRLRISSIEPNLLTDEIIQLTAKSRSVCNHFHIPLQSGSDDILKLMRRRYNTNKFRERLSKIKEIIPDCAIGIDIITGFPGETYEHFEETYKFLDSLPFSYLHVFSYSDRDIAEASKFPGKVPGNVIKERTKALRKLSDKKLCEFYSSQIGKIHTAIPENYNAEAKTFSAWTGNYVKIKFKASSEFERRPVKVKLLEMKTDYVFAEIVE